MMNQLADKRKSIALIAQGLAKTFNSSVVFRNVSFELANGDIMAVSGRNGSGKSTLLKLLCKMIVPTNGKITYSIDNMEFGGDIREYISFVSPYMNLYEEFTPIEHLELAASLCGRVHDRELSDYLLGIFNLSHKKDEYIKTFSSGMKQRLKYIIAVSRKPHILFLDEPFTNLDNEAVAIIDEIVTIQARGNGVVVIASNDEREMKHCNKFVNLNIGSQ